MGTAVKRALVVLISRARMLLGASVALLLTATGQTAPMTRAELSEPSVYSMSLLDYIEAGRSQHGRMEAAVMLVNFVCDLRKDQLDALDSGLITRVTLLLESDEFAYEAAGTLGCLGGRAVAAVPYLEKALQRATPSEKPSFVIQPDFQLDYALQATLDKIRADERSSTTR
jgi:hypothetical protein